ncbi:WD40-repeat-containing domain protein [Haematococcus lacustris]
MPQPTSDMHSTSSSSSGCGKSRSSASSGSSRHRPANEPSRVWKATGRNHVRFSSSGSGSDDGEVKCDVEDDEKAIPTSTLQPEATQRAAYQHPWGDITRVRCLPQHRHLVATKSLDPGHLLLYNIQPLDAPGEEADQPQPFSHQLNPAGGPVACLGPGHPCPLAPSSSSAATPHLPPPQGDGLQWSAAHEGWLLSTCAQGVVAMIQVHDAPSLAAPAAPRPGYHSPPGGSACSPMSPGPHGGELPSTRAGSLTLFTGQHSQGVNEVAWAPEAATSTPVFASVGEEGQLVMWDTRQPPDTAAGVIQAHRGWAQALAWDPCNPHQLVTGGVDACLCVWDSRVFGGALPPPGTQGGVPSRRPQPVHRFPQHQCAVVQAAFSSVHPGYLVSSDEDNRMFVWDISRSASACNALPPYLAGPDVGPGNAPKQVVQLRMVHAGHVGQLNDFAWSTAAGMAPMLASVSGTCAESGQAPQLQVWSPSVDIMKPDVGRAPSPPPSTTSS